MTHVLVVASTFPSSDSDPVPAFVKDQIVAMKRVDSSLQFSVLAPHDTRSDTKNFTKHASYDEYRFHYAWPRSTEKLAGRGIMPALQANPLYYFLIPGLFLFEAVALFRLVRKLQPELIYAHWFTPQAIIARIIGGSTHTPFVFTTHASDVSVWHKIPVFGEIAVRWGVRKAQAYTAVSRRSMEKLSAFFSDKEWKKIEHKATIIPMGVDLPTQSKSSDIDNQNILFIGRLAEKKGVHFLLPAFKNLLNELPDAKLTIAGDGPWLTQLKNQAEELELTDKHVTFPGYTTGQAKQDLIKSHSVYVVPSIITSDGDAEGLPVSLMEGLAYGRLCIATNESGADGILNNDKDGILIPQQDTDAITEAIKGLLTLPRSKKEKISESAKETAKQFSWPVVAKQHIDFLFKDIS